MAVRAPLLGDPAAVGLAGPGSTPAPEPQGQRASGPARVSRRPSLVSAATVAGAGVALLSLPDLDQTADSPEPQLPRLRWLPCRSRPQGSAPTLRRCAARLRASSPTARVRPATKRPASAAASGPRRGCPPATPTVDPTAGAGCRADDGRALRRAFVTYEVGRTNAKVENAFRATASPPLVRALAQRPPRLPAKVDVPKARVLNVVAGRKRGRTLSVSVALLRLGATSELRLQLDKTKAGWLISDVRG